MNTKGTMPKTEYVIEPGKQEIISTTILDAPRELVFKAYTDPKLFAQWWGPRRYEIKIDKFDSRPGGSWRGEHGGARGSRPGVRGVNHHGGAPPRSVGPLQDESGPRPLALPTAPLQAPRTKTKPGAAPGFP